MLEMNQEIKRFFSDGAYVKEAHSIRKGENDSVIKDVQIPSAFSYFFSRLTSPCRDILFVVLSSAGDKRAIRDSSITSDKFLTMFLERTTFKISFALTVTLLQSMPHCSHPSLLHVYITLTLGQEPLRHFLKNSRSISLILPVCSVFKIIIRTAF